MSEAKKRGPRYTYAPGPKLAGIPGIEVVVSNWNKKAIVTASDGWRIGLVCRRTPAEDPREYFWSFIPGSGEPTRHAHFHLRYLINEALNG